MMLLDLDAVTATVGDLVFFAGGSSDFNLIPSAQVDIYNSSSETWTTATLSQPRDSLAATSVGDLVLFGGGLTYDPVTLIYSNSDRVDIYNSTSKTWSTATLSVPRSVLAATTVGTLLIIEKSDDRLSKIINFMLITFTR